METRAITFSLSVGIIVGLMGCGSVSAERSSVDGAAGAGSTEGQTANAGTGGAAGMVVAAGGAAGTVSTDAGVAGAGNGLGGAAGASSPTPNLITNGDFGNGSVGWVATADGTATSPTVTAGEFCVTPTAYSLVAVGWPDSSTAPAALVAGTTYQLSFGVRTNVRMDATTFEDKVGQTASPYTPDFDTGDALAPGSQTITHTFTPAKDDLTAGVVFLIHGPPAGTMFCVDHVALRQISPP